MGVYLGMSSPRKPAYAEAASRRQARIQHKTWTPASAGVTNVKIASHN